MRLRVRPFSLLLFAPLTPACSDWPRFAAEEENVVPFESLRPFQVVEAGDWPDDPSTLQDPVYAELTRATDSVRFEGHLDVFGTATATPAVAFKDACAGITSGFLGVYNGDVDFVRLRHPPGGGLCLYLRPDVAPTGANPQWDAVVYEYSGGCTVGPFLNGLADGLEPEPVVPGFPTHATSQAAELAIYVTGVQDYPASVIGYKLDVVSTSFPDRCPVLTDSDFGAPR